MSNESKSLHELARQCVSPPYIGDRDAAKRLEAVYLEDFRKAATPEAILALTEAHQQVSAEAERLRPVVLDPKDLRISSYSSVTRPGWTFQMVAGVRVVHLPTGLEAVSESERSQHANRGKALAELEQMVARAGAPAIPRVPAGLYRELVALRKLRDAVQNYRERYLLDEIDDVENCVSERQHVDAVTLDEKLDAALFAAWPEQGQESRPAAVSASVGQTTQMFDQMTREELSKWYVTNVGYDLGTEDPAMSLDEFRTICREMYALHSAG